MNIIDFFANGGKTRSQANEEGQAILEVLSSIGVQPEAAESVLTSLAEKNDVETMNIISEAVDTILNSQDMSQINNSKNILKNIFMESQMFKCGGKLQQLITKFGKGGGVDCGCGGIKLDDGGKTLSDRASRTITQKDTIDWYPFKNGIIRSVHPTNGDAPTYQVFDGTTLIAPKYSVAPKLENEIGIFARPFQYFGAARRITPEKAAEYEEARQSTFNVPAKQSGGNIELTPLPGHDVDTRLTRRQARELARVNGMSENNEQFSFAMANAMNAARAMGLRGQEARQRAREMAAGISPAERSITINIPSVNLDTFDFNTNKELPTYTNTKTGITRNFVDIPTIKEGDLKPIIKNPTPKRTYKPTVTSTREVSTPRTTVETSVETASKPETRPTVTTSNVLWGDMPFVSPAFPNQKTHEQIQQEKLDRKAGEYERYMNTTGADEDVAAWGFDPYFKNVDRTSDAYRQGQEQAMKNAGITTIAGTAAALGIPAAIHYAPAAGRFVVNTLKPSPKLLTAEQVQAGWNGGLGAMRDGLFLHKQGGQIEKDITKSLKCGGKTKKKK